MTGDTLRSRVQVLEAATQALTRALDRVRLGIILIQGANDVVFANACARPLLNARDGLALQGDALAATTKQDDYELQRMIRCSTCHHGTSGDSGHGGAMSLRRPAPKRPLSVLVAPLISPEFIALVPLGMAAVFVGDPERAVEAAPECLQRWYGLTRAEGRIATLLMQGMGLPLAARRLGITTHTARSQCKSVFEKTGARRQCDLVRLLVHGPGLVGP